ncbi:MAG: putative ABC transporter permease subunit [Planctomycetaceae bacterium]
MSGRPPPPDAVRLLPFDDEARLFMRLRATLAWETVRSMLADARLRLSLVVLLSGMFWAALYGLFVEGFGFLDALHAEVISLLFNAFFSSLMVMLVFSTGILVYGGLYCSTEARLLLTLPVRPETIHAHTFREAMWFSSWGFVLLGSPMLVAYGAVRHAAWPYYVLLLPFMISFVFIPASVGSIVCMALVAWLPRLRLHALTIGVTVACVAALAIGWSMFSQSRIDAMSAAWFERTFARLSITEQKLFPSWWLSTGLIDAARTERDGSLLAASFFESLAFLALLTANALALQLLAGWVARVAYRRGFSQLISETPSRRRRPLRWFDRALGHAGFATGRPLRLLLVKDFRLFRRDVSQWSQFAIFFGLLGLYFLNLRAFNYNNSYASMIGYLNLAVVGLILSTFTTRFVYPMISLEGRRFWILGLLPVHRDQIVWSKFLFSFVGSLAPCCCLVLLSDCMLGIPWPLIAQHELCCLMLCMGLSGIAVGLGARMPDLRESSPSKISSGFGGTLSLVVSSLFIMATVMLAAVPTHLFLITRSLGPGVLAPNGPFAWAAGGWGAVVGGCAVVALGLAATFIPLSLGLRAFRRLEA